MNPSLREKEDVKAIIRAIQEGFVDTIATDHAPHTAEDKENGAPGMVGLETAFAVCFTSLVKEDYISLNHLSELMSKNPADIMNIPAGEIKVGFDGSLVLIDLEKEYTIDPNEFASKGKNTPFIGMSVFGQIEKTIVKGQVKYSREG